MDVYGHKHEEEIQKICNQWLTSNPDVEPIKMWNNVLKEKWNLLTEKECESYQNIAMKNYRHDLEA
jgi:hypothetical protein